MAAALLLVMIVPAASAVATLSQPKAALSALVSAFPSPGDRFAAPASELVFRGANAAALAGVSVVGNRSGTHAGSIRTLPDGRGASFDPARPFTPGETVAVDARIPLRGAASGRYSFQVAQPAQAPVVVPDLQAAPAAAPVDCPAPTPYTSRPDLRPAGACPLLDTKRSAPGYLFASPEGDGRGGATIYANDGSVVWNTPPSIVADTHNFHVVTIQGQQRLVYFSGGWLAFGVEARGAYVILDEHYHEIGRIESPNGYQPSLHELQFTPEGTALIGSYAPVVTVTLGYPLVVYDYVVQEVDFQHGGGVLFEWHALDHVPMQESRVPTNGPMGTFDYFHGNSIDILPDGDLLVSGRNTWSVYKISRADGHVVWTLGSPANGPGTFGANLLGSDLGWFCYQHDARVQPDGTITVFDNGGGFPAPGCGHPARALTIRLDQSARTATVTRQLRHSPDIFTAFGGDAQALSNGDTLISWADTKRVTEYDASGQPIFEMALGEINYRTYRQEWHGYPLSPPDAVVDGSQVHVSWNGATEVAKWQLLGGQSQDALRDIGQPVAKRGFETTISVPAGTPVVAVQALDASGNPLSNGRAIAGPAQYSATFLAVPVGTVLGFLSILSTFGLPLLTAMLIGLAIGAVVGIVRLIRRAGLRKAAYGLAGVTIQLTLANLFGGVAQSFYPPVLYLNLVYPIAFVVANLVGWPLIGLIAGLVSGRGLSWRRDPALVRAFQLASWYWVGFFALKLVVQLPLYLAEAWVGLAVAKVLMAWPLFIVCISLTVRTVLRAMRAQSGTAPEAGLPQPTGPGSTVNEGLPVGAPAS